MSNLNSVRLKMARARNQRYEIEDAIDAWARKTPFEIAPEIEAPSGEQIWRIKGTPAPPPDDVALLTGECLYNFRAALDHLAWQLDAAPGRHTLFPLARCEQEFAVNRLRGMSDEARALITLAQPYLCINAYTAAMLWALETFVNIDKHRHLNLVAASSGDMIFWFPPSDGGTVGGFGPKVHIGPVESGTEIARFASTDRKVELRVAPGIAFREAGPPHFNASLKMTLIGIDTVLASVMNGFLRSCFADEELIEAPPR